MKSVIRASIISNNTIAEDIFCLKLYDPASVQISKPGQFINIKCSPDEKGVDPYLRRPISIADVNREAGTMDIMYQVKGRGTKLLSERKRGEIINFMGPLGNSFDTLAAPDHAIIVGGGIGVFPLLYLAKELKSRRITIALGFKDKESIVLENEFREIADELIIYTDDGSYGVCGVITAACEPSGEIIIRPSEIDGTAFFTCGPEIMMKRLVRISNEIGIKGQVSIERRMACGIGACLVCVCKLKDDTDSDGYKYSHACKDGPIFWKEDIIFD
jgi:dihydroorotate dehydrogenase electron transfer subunit